MSYSLILNKLNNDLSFNNYIEHKFLKTNKIIHKNCQQVNENISYGNFSLDTRQLNDEQ
jgi:hypothetical protein